MKLTTLTQRRGLSRVGSVRLDIKSKRGSVGKRAGGGGREPSDLFPSPRGDRVAALVEFDVVDESLDWFTR